MADGPADSAHPLPFSIEAEQALLGALLCNNDVFHQVEGFLRPQHFYDPVHGRIFALAQQRIERGSLANPTTLATFLRDDPGLAELGGPAYLARLAGAAISVFAVRDYARIVHDLALRRDLVRIGMDIVGRAASVEAEGDPARQITEAEQALYSLAERGRYQGGFQDFATAMEQAIRTAGAAYHRDGGLAGLSTGFIDLDRKLGGLHPSDLVIIAGRPSMGKTALATNIAFHLARTHRRGLRPDGTEGTVDGGVVGFFSLEMSAEQLAHRILAEQSGIPANEIRRGDISEEEFRRLAEVAATLQRIPLYIDDTGALPISTLAARARRLKRQHGLDALFVDYLQLVRPARAQDSRVNEVAEITQGLKAIAKELDIPVVALSQLSRQVESREDKRPQLSDLRESGSIEQDADVVMFVYREEYYREREKPGDHEIDRMIAWQQAMEKVHNKAEVILGKQRHGPIGTVELIFDARVTRFANPPRPYQQG